MRGKIKVPFPYTKSSTTPWRFIREWQYDPVLPSSWLYTERLVAVTLRPLYSHGKSFLCSLHAGRGQGMTAEKRRNSKTVRIEPLSQGRPASTPVTQYQCWRIFGTRKEILRTRQLLLSKLLICFARTMSLYCEECLYIHIPECVEIVCELPCLPNNTASEIYLHKFDVHGIVHR